MGEKNVDESMEGKTANVGAVVKAALKAMKKKQLPCSKKKKTNRVSIFSPWRNMMVSVQPYSATAKKLYRFYIEELGFDVNFFLNSFLHHGIKHGQEKVVRSMLCRRESVS